MEPMLCDLTTIFIEAWTWISWCFRHFIPHVTLAAPERWWCGALRFEWFWSNAVAGNWWNVVSLRWWCPEVWIRPAALHCGYCLCLVTIFVYSGDDTKKLSVQQMMGWMVSIPPKNPLWCCWFSPGWPGVDVATENRSFRGWGEGFTVESQQSHKKRPRLAEILHSPVILEKKYEGQQKSGFKKKPKLWSKWKKWEERWEELVPFGAFFFR